MLSFSVVYAGLLFLLQYPITTGWRDDVSSNVLLNGPLGGGFGLSTGGLLNLPTFVVYSRFREVGGRKDTYKTGGNRSKPMLKQYVHPETRHRDIMLEVNILSVIPPAGGTEGISGYEELP